MGEVTWTMDADTQRVVRAVQKIVDKQTDAVRKAHELKMSGREVGSSMERVGNQAEDMGRKSGGALDSMTRGFSNMVLTIGGVGAAVAAVTKDIQAMNAEREAGAQSAMGSLGAMQMLAQVAESPADYRRMLKASADLSIREGVDFTESLKARFAARSLQLTDEEMAQLEPFARVAGGPGNFQTVVQGVGKYLAGFTREEAGSPWAVLNKVGIAAKTADVPISEMMPEATVLGAPSRMAGFQDEEMLGALSVLSAGQGKTPAIAATQIRSLLTAIMRSPESAGLRGGTLQDAVERLRKMSPDERRDIIGDRVEAHAALQGLIDKMDSGDYSRVMGAIWEQQVFANEGRPYTYIGQTIRNIESVPLAQAALARRRAAAKAEISKMTAKGAEKLDWDTMVDNAETAIREDPDLTGPQRFFWRLMLAGDKVKSRLGWDDRSGLIGRMRLATGRDVSQPEGEVRSLDEMLGDKPVRPRRGLIVWGEDDTIETGRGAAPVISNLGAAAADLRSSTADNRKSSADLREAASALKQVLTPGANKDVE